MGWLLLATGAEALPGQPADEVAAWIAAHPTLRPRRGETLSVTKTDTPAQRFTFEASSLPPGPLEPSSSGLIRTERLEIFDLVNGVSADRLAEALRIIYGLDIYQDYQEAKILYEYPTPQMMQRSREDNAPILAARKGQLRAGQRYGYWIEVVDPEEEKAVIGEIKIFPRSDLDDLEAFLREL